MSGKIKAIAVLLMVIMITVGCTTALAATERSNTVEEKIIDALKNKTTYIFEISDDHVFLDSAASSSSIKTDSGTTQYANTSAAGENGIRSWSAGDVIRIDNGVVSMAQSNYYNCSLVILDDDQGIAIHITTKNSVQSFNNELVGIIQGNMLTASQSVVTATYSNYAQMGLGNSFSASYQVSLKSFSENQYPPKAVVLDHEMELGGSWGDTILSITLTWQDSNEPGVVGYYEVYKLKGVSGDAECVATVDAGTTTWVDQKPGTLWDMFEYYIITYTPDGIPSETSNIEIF